MTKRDVLKTASAGIGGLIGGVLGALPGVFTFKKEDKLKSIANVLAGASIGNQIGFIGGGLAKSDDPNSTFRIPKRHEFYRPSVNNVLSTILASGPGIIDVSRLTDKDTAKTKGKAVSKLLLRAGVGYTAGSYADKIFGKY